MEKLIGRIEEQSILEQTLSSSFSEFVAIYGRRRVGKTFLIRKFYDKKIIFEIVGVHNTSMSTQLQNFTYELKHVSRNSNNLPVPKNWNEAFHQLETWIETLKSKSKKIIFIDELPWLVTKKSGMLQALSHFWNAWASKRNDIILVVCGSAASWVQDKLIEAKGGLHNRITRRIRLLPFTLAETRQYFKYRKISLNPKQIIELYMAIGGIPHYLKEIQRGQSSSQAIDFLCFSKNGLLADEFNRLYKSLFDNSDEYIKIIRALSSKRQGLTRNEILLKTKMRSGGRLTSRLVALEQCGFIQVIYPFGCKKSDFFYRLADEYSLFYLNWIENKTAAGKNIWIKLQSSQKWKSWSGYAFESICLKHIDSIKHGLGIAAVDTNISTWKYSPNSKKEGGAQIDLVIDRKDDTINVCEIKFVNHAFVIDKKYYQELLNKLDTFQRITKTNKNILLTFITSYGLKKNDYFNELVEKDLTMDILLKSEE